MSRYLIQRTDDAYVTPPDSAFYTVGKANTEKGVKRHLGRLRALQPKGSGWLFNVRVVDTTAGSDQKGQA
jgi:hypothetical protein